MTVPLNSVAEFRWRITSPAGVGVTGLVDVPVNVYGQDGSGTPITSGTLTEIAEGLYRYELSSGFTATAGRLSAVIDLSAYAGVDVQALCDEVCVLNVGNVTSIYGSAAAAAAISLLYQDTFSLTITSVAGNVLTLGSASLPLPGWVAYLSSTRERRVVIDTAIFGGGPTYTVTLDRPFNADPTGLNVAFIPESLFGMIEDGSTFGLSPILLDAAISSRLATSGYTAPDNTTIGTVNIKLGTPVASVSDDVAAVKTDTGNLVTRITSTLFSGITSLAQWLGLIAGKQTGNTTARTELRATGAGSGTYDETKDSQEAMRDRGDAAWTGSTAADVAEAVANRLGSLANITVIGIVTGDTIDMVKGDEYLIADGREWRFTKIAGEPWPSDLTGHTITLTVNKSSANANDGDSTQTCSGTITTATGDSQSVYFEPNEAFTDGLAVGAGAKGYEFDVVAIKSGVKKTLRIGLMTVRRNQTATP